MTNRIDAWFIVLGAVLLIAGMGLGEYMAASQDHVQQPTHAHLNLVGGVFSILFGLAYRSWPELKTNVAVVHFWAHALGSAVMVAGLAVMFSVGAIVPAIIAATLGSVIVLLGMAVFAVRFWGLAQKPAMA